LKSNQNTTSLKFDLSSDLTNLIIASMEISVVYTQHFYLLWRRHQEVMENFYGKLSPLMQKE